jgi:hypothetical protein
LDSRSAPRGNTVSSDCGAKACIFSACERGLKKDRAHFKAKTPAFPTCRSWWLKLRHSIKGLYVISLVALCRAAKERFPKASSFGKPKVQVCLFAKREHRAPHGRKHCSLWRVFLVRSLPRGKE